MQKDAVQHITAATAIDFGTAGVLNVTYYPNLLTPGRLTAAQNTPAVGQFAALVDLNLALLADWDMLAGDQKVAITQAELNDLGIDVLNGILNGIKADMLPKSTSAPS